MLLFGPGFPPFPDLTRAPFAAVLGLSGVKALRTSFGCPLISFDLRFMKVAAHVSLSAMCKTGLSRVFLRNSEMPKASVPFHSGVGTPFDS